MNKVSLEISRCDYKLLNAIDTTDNTMLYEDWLLSREKLYENNKQAIDELVSKGLVESGYNRHNYIALRLTRAGKYLKDLFESK